jgi:hypothetical protein
MPATALGGAGLRVVDEVVVLHLAGRDDIAGSSGTGKQTRTAAPSGSGSATFEEDAACRDVARDAVDLAEQQRFQPHHEHLVEAEMRPLVVDDQVGGGGAGFVALCRRLRNQKASPWHHPTVSCNEVKKLTCRIIADGRCVRGDADGCGVGARAALVAADLRLSAIPGDALPRCPAGGTPTSCPRRRLRVLGALCWSARAGRCRAARARPQVIAAALCTRCTESRTSAPVLHASVVT